MTKNTAVRDTKVLIVTNLKGGVSKTTATLHLAAGLAELGRKSLVVDFDSTGGATSLLGVPDFGPWPSAYEFITGSEDAADCILTDGGEFTLPHGVDLVPGSQKLEELDVWLTNNRYIAQQDLLTKPMEQVKGQYDYVFIDLPPRISPATVPSMKAADGVVLCAIPEDAAVRYLTRTWNDVQQARQYGLKVEVLGILLTGIRKPLTRLARHLIGQVAQAPEFTRADGSPLKFDTDISLGVAMQESQAARQTLFQYEPDHTICEQYRAVVRELEARIKLQERSTLVPTPPPAQPAPPAVGEEATPAVTKEAANG